MPPIEATPSVERRIIVDVGHFFLSDDPAVSLATYSLGSGLGITLHDPVARVGGLLHAMLPDSATDPDRAILQPGTFIDTGLAALVRAAQELKVDLVRSRLCVAGGAQFLDDTGFFDLGLRNYQRLSALLGDFGITLTASSVGDLVSRSVRLNVFSGEVRLKTSGMTMEKVLFEG